MALAFCTVVVFLLSFSASVSARDPSPLQDFCVAVADSAAAVLLNGKICKNPSAVVVDDFSFQGLNKSGNTTNREGSAVTPVNVNQLPGLNTLGVSLARTDFAPYGVNPPHIHARASEVIFVLQGALYVGFVTSNPDNPNMKNQLFARTLFPGDMFVFPQSLVHFQYNPGSTNAVALSGFGSQNPGVTTIGSAVFGSNPSINPAALGRAFHVEKNVVEYLQSQT